MTYDLRLWERLTEFRDDGLHPAAAGYARGLQRWWLRSIASTLGAFCKEIGAFG